MSIVYLKLLNFPMCYRTFELHHCAFGIDKNMYYYMCSGE